MRCGVRPFMSFNQIIGLRKLIIIDRAKGIVDLKILPTNHLEQLFGDRSGSWSVRTNKQWRICFT